MHPIPSEETLPRRAGVDLTYRLVAWTVATPLALGRRVMRGPRVPDLSPLASGAVRLGLAPFCIAAVLGWRLQSACLRGALRALPRRR
ncbi:hypothetical protein [Niveibacterium sp. COAC-50]|uniref:hypothetical protein n=1 Tax=Niveibacterium sp. COAC-50 TaxID=2729384 RepID=UPI001554EB5F|nr:hypothetical protein [Niveibacterium sp. COAC-50]